MSELPRLDSRKSKHRLDAGHQQLALTVDADLGGLGEHLLAVVQGDGDSRGGGVEGKQKHAFSLLSVQNAQTISTLSIAAQM